jgi:hypothetical protein
MAKFEVSVYRVAVIEADTADQAQQKFIDTMIFDDCDVEEIDEQEEAEAG